MLKWFAQQPEWRDRVVVAHVNHMLRDDAERVAALVERQAASLGVPCVVAHANVPAARAIRNESIEACARRLRYAALEEVRIAQKCALVLTAHTLDDDAETVLMKLELNSSWFECTGIPVKRSNILRPFLRHTRTDLRREVSIGDTYDLDPMNEDPRFLRVLARGKLILLTRQRWGAVSRLSEHGQRIQMLQDLTARLIKCNTNNNIKDRISNVYGLEILPKNLYLEDLDFLVAELGWAAQVGQLEKRLKSSIRRKILEFLRASSGQSALKLPGGVSLHRAGKNAWLVSEAKSGDLGIPTFDRIVFTPDIFKQETSGRLSFSYSALQTVNVRQWSPGERFKPAARRRRKISDWLSEAKIHPSVRVYWPVVCLENEIVAVPGLGVAEHALPRADKSVMNIHWKAYSLSDKQVPR